MRQLTPARAYGDDLAYIHDAGHTDFARKAAPGLLALLARPGVPRGRVVDLGCGSGVWAERLVQAGYKVLGVDISPGMIALARERVPTAEFACASFHDVDLPPCAAVTSIGECLGYLFDRINRRRALGGLFRRVYDALLPGGVFVFDVLQPGFVPTAEPLRRFRTGPDWAVLVEVTEDPKTQTLTRRITSFREVDGAYRRSEECHQQRLLRAADLTLDLRRIGFRVRRLRGYGELTFTRTGIGLLARKPTVPI